MNQFSLQPALSRLKYCPSRGVLSVLALAFVLGCGSPFAAPEAVDGRIDLSDWHFEEAGNVDLFGEWAICWGQLLDPSEPACPGPGWQLERVPGAWSEAGSGSPFGGQGVATYRLQLALPAGKQRLAIRAGAALTSARIWLDGEPHEGTGKVGLTSDTTSAEPRRNRVFELEGGGEHRLQVQVANFEFRGGGLRRAWTIGRSEAIQAMVGRSTLREALLFGVGVLVGLAYLVQFALRPDDRARGYFGLAALTLGLRAVPASISDFGQLLVPWASFGLLLRFEYLGIAVVMLAGSGYFLTKVPDVMPPWPIRVVQLFSIALAIVALVAPMPLVLETLVFYLVLPVCVIGLVILAYGRAWLRGVPGVAGTLAGAILYLVVIGHDVLRTLESGLGFSIELFPYFIVIWILAEANGLMQSFNRTFDRVASLSDDLSDANLELQETESAVVRFVPFDFLRLLGKHSIREVGVGDHARARMTVLYCALRPPGRDARPEARQEEIEADFEAFNALVGLWEPAIYHRDGFVSHYVGHGLFALFPEAPEEAVHAALEIVETVDAFNRQRAASTPPRPPFEIGVGITCGTLLVGTVGGDQHLASGVLGEAIDEAPRIEALTHSLGTRILVTGATRDAMADPSVFSLRALDPARLGNAALPCPIFEVMGVAERAAPEVDAAR